MGAQLRINANTTPRSLIQMSGTEYNYTHHQILTAFAASNTGVGTVQVNPANTTGLTLIGSFTDTYRNFNVGDHPIGTSITNVVYNFYQNQGSVSESGMIRPVEFIEGAPDNIKEQDDTSLNADSINGALANLVSTGLGSYALQPSAPAGGTWTAEATITNNLDANATNSNVTYLWRKTATTAPTTFLPLKINNTTPKSLMEMSDGDIQTLTTRLRNRIVATGIGTYKVQSATPSPGTWVTAGSAFSDTTRTASDAAYGGTYSGSTSYSGTYSRQFSGVYNSPSYTGAYNGPAYTGGYNAGNFAGGTFAASYTGTYFGTYFGGYAANYGGFFGPSYTGGYTGGYSGSYSGINYTATFSRTYSGAYTRTFSGAYTSQYTGAYTGAFSGTYGGAGGYTGSYTGLTLNNDSSTVGSVSLWIRTA